MVCATTSPFFNDTDSYYKDRYNLLQKFCSKRQNSTACCGRKDKDKCELKMKYKEWQNVTINLDSVSFGGSCTYKVEAKCGYPALTVNNSNIDMVVTFKKKEWDDDNYDPDQNETYDDDEAHKGHHKDGHTDFKMDKKDKHDDDEKEDKCQKTKLYLTLTNLNNPTKLAESRLLQDATPVQGY